MSIRGKLSLLMLAIGLVPTVAVGAASYIIISNELTDKTNDLLTSTATKQEQKISSALQTRQEEVVKLTNRFDLQSALERYQTTKGVRGSRSMHDIIGNRKAVSSDIQAIYICGIDGTVLAGTRDGSTGTKLDLEQLYKDRSKETSIKLMEDQRDGINKLYISTVMNVNKQQAGFLTIVFRTDDIVATVQDYTGLGATGETVLSAAKDGRQVSLFPLRFNTDAALRQDLESLFDTTGDQGTASHRDYRGMEVLAVSRPTSFADWTVTTKMDRREALASIANLRRTLETIIIVSSLAIAVIAFIFTRFFTRPILQISDISRRIGQGDFAARITLRRRDEVGALAANINAMGTSLEAFVDHLKTQRQRLEIILNNTEEAILAIDKDSVIIIANEASARLVGRPVQDIVGKHMLEVFAWQCDNQPASIDYTKPGSETYDNFACMDAAGERHYTKVVVTGINNPDDDDTAQAIITIHDETKDRDLEDMKVDFVSMAAHELRTPLAAIRGYIELMSYKLADRPDGDGEASGDVRRYIDLSLKSSAELGGLITNLLDVTRIEKGTLSLNPEPMDLAADLRQAVNTAGFNGRERDIAISYDGPEQGCQVMADPISLHEVMNNLLTNAIKYTEAKGSVKVSLHEQDGEYQVHIRDTGIGIPQAALSHLFTKFYRVHGGLNSGSTGTGLGLFISRSIIERHGGRISVESTEGVGSTFTFTLPKCDTCGTDGSQTDDGMTGATSTRRKRGWTTQNIAR